jgi:Flp pilus assembly protein TadD
LQIAQDLDPLGAGPRFNQAMAFLLEHRFEDAKRLLQQSIDSNVSVLDSHLMLGVTAIYQGDCKRASEHFTWFAQHFPSPVANFGLAFGAACNGQKDRARQLIAQAEAGKGSAFVSPYQAAMAWAWVGEKDAALENLEKSAEAREGQILYIPYDPAFDSIRSDARFIALEKKIGQN